MPGFLEKRPFFEILGKFWTLSQFLKNPPIGDRLQFSRPGWQIETRYKTVNLSGFLGHTDSWFGHYSHFSAKKVKKILVPRWFLKNLPIGDHLRFGLGGSHLKHLDLSSA